MIKSSLFSFLLFISVSLFGQNTPEVKGFYGENLKNTAHISGSHIIQKIASQPALNKRGIQNVVVLIKPSNSFLYQYIGFSVFENKTEEIPLSNQLNNYNLDSIVEETIKNHSSLKLCNLAQDQKEQFYPYFKNGIVTNKEIVSELIKTLDQAPDAFILIEEQERGDFIGGSKVQLASKGIYESQYNSYIYSSYQITIIGTKKLKKIKAGKYIQASADFLPFKLKKDQLLLSDSQTEIVSQKLIERHQNNIKRSLLLFKVWK